jgi:hypothetical protein
MKTVQLHPLPIVIATVIYFVIGGIWFSPAVFFPKWLALIGKTTQDLEKNFSYWILLWGAVTAAIVNVALAYVLGIMEVRSALWGAAVGALVWAAFIGTTSSNNYLFEARSLRLFWLNMGYPLLAMVVSGAILAKWSR